MFQLEPYVLSLKTAGFGVTSLDAQGNTGKVNIIYTVIQRSALDDVLSIIKRDNPKAFFSIEDVKHGGVVQ